jgi:hypothetical protein
MNYSTNTYNGGFLANFAIADKHLSFKKLITEHS